MNVLILFHNEAGPDELELVAVKEDFYEFIIIGHGSRHYVIVAKHFYDAVICIPLIGVSCELAALNDV